jgi:type IV secretion system protein TrbL
LLYFAKLTEPHDYKGIEYTCIAPAAALQVILLVAGECLRFSEEKTPGQMFPDFGRIVRGLLAAFFVIFTGVLAVIEYVMAFLEFMLVTGVGVILLPMMIWDGSKFLSEKLISAIIGFFIKLLFCNICIFLLLYGYYSLATRYTEVPFTGTADELVMLIFTCLFFFIICTKGPNLAQSLLTGSPTLNGASAISAVSGAIAGAAGVAGVAGAAGGALAKGGARAAFAGAGAVSQAAGAAGAVGQLGGSMKDKAGAALSAVGGSMKQAMLAGGGNMARSLLSGGKGGGGGGSAGAGVNRHSEREKFLGEKNADGTKQSFKEHLAGRKEAGTNAGIDYMAKKEAKQNGN